MLGQLVAALLQAAGRAAPQQHDIWLDASAHAS
jgi:hypothetical protein